MGAFLGFGIGMRFAVESAKKEEFHEVYHFDSKKDLLNKLLNQVTASDIVLVKGSRGMHMEDIVEGLVKEIGGC